MLRKKKPTISLMLQQDLDLLNQAIRNYHASKSENKLTALQAVDHARKVIEEKYPASFFYHSYELQKALNDAFKLTKQAASALGYRSLLDFHNQADNRDVPFADLLANMPPAILAELTQVLLKVPLNEAAFKTLYPEDDPNYPQFKVFNDQYTIKCLGKAGSGNSKNFLISKSGEPSFVLKLDVRLDQPTQHEAALRQKQHPALAKVFAERPVHKLVPRNDGKEHVTSSISIVEHCPDGDLDTKIKKSPVESRIDLVLDLATKSAKLLIDLKAAGYGLPDGKFTNLLVRSDGTICLADTKSLLKVHSNGRIYLNDQANQLFGGVVLHTKGFINPEFGLSPGSFPARNFSADKMHAYQLGKNIYTSLTGCSYSNLELLTATDVDTQAKQAPPNSVEKRLLELVAQLINPDPERRPDMAYAKDELLAIRQLHQDNKLPQTILSSAPTIKPTAPKLISHLFVNNDLREFKGDCSYKLIELRHQLGFGSNDKIMNNYVSTMQTRITQAKTMDELANINSSLDAMLEKQRNPKLQAINDRIKYFRANASLMTIGMSKKADKIAQVMLKVPLEQRDSIFDSQSNAAVAAEVKKELTEKRYWNPFIKEARSFTLLKDVLGNESSETKKDSTRSNH